MIQADFDSGYLVPPWHSEVSRAVEGIGSLQETNSVVQFCMHCMHATYIAKEGNEEVGHCLDRKDVAKTSLKTENIIH